MNGNELGRRGRVVRNENLSALWKLLKRKGLGGEETERWRTVTSNFESGRRKRRGQLRVTPPLPAHAGERRSCKDGHPDVSLDRRAVTRRRSSLRFMGLPPYYVS